MSYLYLQTVILFSAFRKLCSSLANVTKASIFVFNIYLLLLAAVCGTVYGTESALHETQVSYKGQLGTVASGIVPTVAGNLDLTNMKTAPKDPGDHAESASLLRNHYQTLESPGGYDQPQATAHPNNVIVKCKDQDLQKVCDHPPINIRCSGGCEVTSVCPVIVDYPHMRCESECTCVAGDQATIPTVNEFADLE